MIQISESELKGLIYNAILETIDEKTMDSNNNEDVGFIDPDMNLGVESVY